MPAPARIATTPPARTYRSRLGRLALAGRWDGLGWGEPFGLLPFGLLVPLGFRPAVSTGGRSEAGAVTVEGCEVIDPHSTGVERHQFQVAEQLQAGGQVSDVKLVQLVLAVQHGRLRAE